MTSVVTSRSTQVVIGATALRAWLPDERRLTEDVDVALALDLPELGPLTARLEDLGWRRDARWEPRWHAPGGARVDLLPLGVRARQDRQLVWPRADTTMPVVGSGLVFRETIVRELGPDFRMRVAPLHVLALLRAVAFLDEPAARLKDLQDLVMILRRYAEDDDRRFSDQVIDADVQYDEAGAFLLGCDLQALCREEDEVEAVRRFLRWAANRHFDVPHDVARGGPNEHEEDARDFARLCRALARGFGEPT
jgi:predicted nucleotidyltransferase